MMMSDGRVSEMLDQKSYVSMPRNLADQNDQQISQDWADRDKLRGTYTSPSLLAASWANSWSAVVEMWWSFERN